VQHNGGVPRDDTGLTHVATVSFLASRAAPSGQFWLALGGGVALARAAAVRGAATGYGAAAAALLQSVAVMGPARFNGPLTQALTAPVMGRLQARGAPVAVELAACLGIRLLHYAVLSALFIYIVLGGVDEYTAAYERLTGWTGVLPQGTAGALAVGAAASVAQALFFTTVQVAVYRRALGRWPAAAGGAPQAGSASAEAVAAGGARRFDPRAVVAAAVVASALLLTGTSWVLLLGVAGWLAAAWVLAGGDRTGVRLGAALAGMLAFAALTGGLLGGAGLDLAVRRAVRAALLVAVATWMRAAAGSDGLREVFRRALRRLRRLPPAAAAAELLDGLDGGPRLIAAGHAAATRLAGARLRPVPIADALCAWVASEAAGYRTGGAPAAPVLRARTRDRLLVVVALAPALALLGT
jgi:hypothetical protein